MTHLNPYIDDFVDISQSSDEVPVTVSPTNCLLDAAQVTSNGVDVGTFESSSETASGYTTFVLHADDVETLTLTPSGLGIYEWISLLEVTRETMPLLQLLLLRLLTRTA